MYLCTGPKTHSLYLFIHLILAPTALHTFHGDTCSHMHNFNNTKHERHVDLCRNIFSQTNATQSLQSVLHLTSVQWQYYSPAENTHDATGETKKRDNVQKMKGEESKQRILTVTGFLSLFTWSSGGSGHHTQATDALDELFHIQYP